ncbi:3-deoxy-7-phosphoheptulonate synthase [Ructibacterium gallinarum]|uniref:3-deoxy-7-phosphoheptulonate synthase n=1 Tax=Ructibacterium gallinarum TaxID=2779355 RepID=A0A9D5LX53_9FIRM|nr:3-deoxy-7-phosphoheptulonate synthase [Ructibacterium gallinarum]MBE5039453.1 3-deoxy-7-phosphoheptulonate synthase [Ructibacterium gallinarum]
MVVIMKPGTTESDIEKMISYVKDMGLDVMVNKGVDCTVLGLLGDTSRIDPDTLMLNIHVDRVMRIAEPFKKASRKFHPDSTVVRVGDAEIGKEKTFTVIAGPCSVESEEQIIEVAESVKESGAKLLRGGAFKPRTSPYSFQGLELEGIALLKEAKEKTGLPIVTEIMSPAMVETFEESVDIIQVGARNMQNFDLLKELGKSSKPILLKRGLSSTIEEWLMSAEYILAGGNSNVILCERGIRTFETYTRNTLDLSAIPAVKRLSHLPVIVDPSHSAGMSWMVEPLSLAAMAVGADGLIVEVHNCPEKALCDGAQSLNPGQFKNLMQKLKGIGSNLGLEV